MAQKIQTLFIDDIDGTAAEGTVRFGLDGSDYEIDLNAAHAANLRKSLEKYIAASRKAPGATRRPTRGGRRTAATGIDTTTVRTWAREQGIDIRDRGRVSAEIVTKYREAVGA